MKTRNLLATCLMASILCVGNASAQGQNKDKQKQVQQCPTTEERINKQTEAMQKRLLLDEKEAAQFAPIYKEYLGELAKCRPDFQKQEKDAQPTDAEIEKRIENRFAMQKKMVETQESYYKKLKKVLNARQLEQVFMKNDFAPKRMQGQHPNGMGARPDMMGQRPKQQHNMSQGAQKK